MTNNDDNRLGVLIESFKVLDGYYFIGNDNTLKEYELDIDIVESLISYFEFCKDEIIVKSLKNRLDEINNYIKDMKENEEKIK